MSQQTTVHPGAGPDDGVPQSIRGDLGASILGPRNVPLERVNPNLLASPYTDAGTIPNLKFSFATARNRLLTGGWAREVTVRELPVATELVPVMSMGRFSPLMAAGSPPDLICAHTHTKQQKMRNLNTIVIIGAGAAGLTTAQTLRQLGIWETIMTVHAEPTPPYDRPPCPNTCWKEQRYEFRD